MLKFFPASKKWRMKDFSMTLLFCTLLLSACGRQLDFDAMLHDEDEYTLYTALQINNMRWDGPLQMLDSTDSKIRQMRSWLKQHNTRWSKDFGTYDFPKIMLCGHNFIFCVYDNYVIVQQDGIQYTHKSNFQDFAFLFQDVRNAFDIGAIATDSVSPDTMTCR